VPNNRDGDELAQTFDCQQLEVKGLQPGTVLNDRYEIVRRLDAGKLSAVYLANDRKLRDSPCAVEEFVGPDLGPVQRNRAIADFNSEMLLMASLGHPSIPMIGDYFYVEQPGRFYVVSEYISGDDLVSRMHSAARGRIDEKMVTEWAIQIADALEYLHTQPRPIIYQNLKPKKVIIDDKRSRAMLINSGIAHWLKQKEKRLIGTIGYAPPELFAGRVEPRSDIYSLGAIIFQLLTAADPQDDPLLVFDFTKNPKPRQITPSISTEMEQILMRSVEHKPEDRFASAGEMRDTLSIHLERLIAERVSYGVPAPVLANETVQVQSVYCGFCGSPLANDVFCAYCGERANPWVN
jgi:serine/threonine-protein kinase